MKLAMLLNDRFDGVAIENEVKLDSGAAVAIGHGKKGRFLVVRAAQDGTLPAGFAGETVTLDDGKALIGALDAANAAALRKHFPWTRPVSLRKRRTTVGCGDRLGLATAGHIAAAAKYRIAPVLAQQSVRELNMTNRTFQGVVDDACFWVFSSNYRDGYGADGDHLKTFKDIDNALAAEMPMITLDLSDVMNAAAGDWSNAKIAEAFAALDPAYQAGTKARYAEKTFDADGSVVTFQPGEAERCAVMYGKAIDFAVQVHARLVEKRGSEFDLEISIDETSAPTIPAHHWFIAAELHRLGVEFSSLAPRFVGEFQKAIDYIGDLAEFDRQFTVHAGIARANGNYKVSVHSGSDKFSVYPTVGRETRGYLHLKTAGTSWLVAVELIACKRPALYRKMHACALANVQEMLKLYHITADFNKIPAVSTLSDGELPKLMQMPEARQLLHINYGPILTGELREEFFRTMQELQLDYTAAVAAHIGHHLELLNLQ